MDTEGENESPIKSAVLRMNSMESTDADMLEMAQMMAGGEKGLAKLHRVAFTAQETADRLKHVQTLKKTLAQIDGTIRADTKVRRAEKKPKEQYMYEFGMAFYEELFERSPEVRNALFTKPAELLATKLGEILAEAVRLLEIETPSELLETLTEMALRHIAYGLQDEHVEPFKECLIATLKSTVKSRGFKWNQKTKRAWDWSLTEITDLLMDGVNSGRPRVQNLQRSWVFLCERLYMEDYELRRTTRSSFVSTMTGASQFGPSMKSMLGDYTANTKAEDAPKTIKIGNETVEMPQKKSKKKVMAKSNAQKERERLRQKAKKRSKEKEAEQSKSKAKFSIKLLAARTVGALRVAVTSLTSAGSSSTEEDEFRMWSKKDLVENATEEYQHGRFLVGQKFIKVFAANNPWAVTQFSFGLKEEHAEKMGEALELIVNSSTKPQVLAHKLRVLAVQHVHMGVKASMFPSFEEALFEFLKTTLGEYGEWNKPTEQAWKWMWDIVNKKFSAHMATADRVVGLVERSWKYVEDNYDLEDISDIFFKEFFFEAPVLQAYFVKPTKMQRVMFEKAMTMIVKSVRDVNVHNIELKGIAMRHIKYDITVDHLRTFGKVLMNVLRNTAGEDHWDEEVEGAWLDVYGHIAEIFNHIISTGKNLVSRALATGSPDELKQALGAAGRKARVLASLEIETDDSIISPIVWTLQEGQMDMAEGLLKDAVAIRGDREAYYCGRERLWRKHPWLIRLLVDKEPKLLTTLLDGHLWVSRFMEDGKRRVNFYIDELYGKPEHPENRNAYNTALGVFVSELPLSELHVFAHPVVIFLTDVKWKQFGFMSFLQAQFLNMGILVLGVLYLLGGDKHPMASFVLALLQLIAVVLRVSGYHKSITVQLRFGNGVHMKIFGRQIFWPYALSDPFMIINLIASILCLTTFAYTWRADPFGWKPALMPHRYSDVGHDEELLTAWADVAAFSCGMLCIQLVECFKLTKTMSAMLFAILAVIPDVVRFMSILFLWSVGFAFIIYWLMVGERLHEGLTLDQAMHIDMGDGHEGPHAVIYFELLSYIKLTIIQVITRSGWTVRIVFAVCVWSSVMMLLNLLVSNMVYNYLTLYRSFAELAVRARAELVLRAEEIMPMKKRTMYYERCMFHEKVDFDKGDDGLTGGMQEIMVTREMTHPAFQTLDRVERYSGTTDPAAPWNPAEMHSGPTTDRFAHHEVRGRGNQEMERDATQEGGPIDLSLLRQVSHNFARLNQELFLIKRSVAGDDATSLGSTASGASDVTAVDNWNEPRGMVMEYVRRFTANLLVRSGVRQPAETIQLRRDNYETERPSTARKALSATQAMQQEMVSLQSKMMQMMAELQELRSSGLQFKPADSKTNPNPNPRTNSMDELMAEVDAGNTADVQIFHAHAGSDDYKGGSDMGSALDADTTNLKAFNMDTFSDTGPHDVEGMDMDEDVEALMAEIDAEHRSEEMKDTDSEDEVEADGDPEVPGAEDSLQELTLTQLQEHNTANSLWMAVDGTVYDLTNWLGSHPGGRAVLLGEGGTDASVLFSSIHTGSAHKAATGTLQNLPKVGLLAP
eukprot:CAMPEP_0117667338 /NCGR_PEP_ID=MMETSP0804-20121206/10902_1 /TAXON_ID=1074897 /ORGANISM="Tetraselmis astigmatica, Strain CCMP880" /LENGTH=1564 /DNA_ID=CAMNT_0005475035 /DNA_START=106 /DNA_END=4800 /DNA_ORIENTATION=-